jgi:hypothetical protein
LGLVDEILLFTQGFADCIGFAQGCRVNGRWPKRRPVRALWSLLFCGRNDRMRMALTGQQLKDPTATVAYHTTDQAKLNEVLGRRGVKRAAFANRAVEVANDLEEIVRATQLYS